MTIITTRRISHKQHQVSIARDMVRVKVNIVTISRLTETMTNTITKCHQLILQNIVIPKINLHPSKQTVINKEKQQQIIQGITKSLKWKVTISSASSVIDLQFTKIMISTARTEAVQQIKDQVNHIRLLRVDFVKHVQLYYSLEMHMEITVIDVIRNKKS